MNFFRIVGIIPLGIGLTVLYFMWIAPDGMGPFGGPPLFFRLFASFIALAFVLQGGAMVSGAITNPDRLRSMASRLNRDFGSTNDGLEDSEGFGEGRVGYQCSGCGAPLADNADVSPHGDVKCTHCGTWFNIHKGR